MADWGSQAHRAFKTAAQVGPEVRQSVLECSLGSWEWLSQIHRRTGCWVSMTCCPGSPKCFLMSQWCPLAGTKPRIQKQEKVACGSSALSLSLCSTVSSISTPFSKASWAEAVVAFICCFQSCCGPHTTRRCFGSLALPCKSFLKYKTFGLRKPHMSIAYSTVQNHRGVHWPWSTRCVVGAGSTRQGCP